MARPVPHETFFAIARVLSRRATCSRRQVGCVLLNEHSHIIGTGYNGVGKGLTHCTDSPCAGASLPSGVGLDTCEAIHAEQNALLQCPNVQSIHTAYVTCSPCIHCAKLFLNTSVKFIYCEEIYDESAVAILTRAGIQCTAVPAS